MKISMKKALLFAMVAGMAITTRVSTQQYSATQVANFTFDDVNMFFRALILPAVAYTPSTRQYSLDMIFNYVYDAPTHSLRISGSGGSAPDSAHEWAHAWIDTALAKHYASKAGLALDFWMRGVRGDTLAKYTDRHGNVVAWIDTVGSSTWNILKPKFIRPQAAATVNDTIYVDDDSTDVPLIYLMNRGVGTESVCILLSAKIEALDASSTTRSAVIGRSDANGYAGIQGQNTANGPGIGGQANGSGPGGNFTSAGGPGSRSRGVVGAEFIGIGETLFVARRSAGGVAKVWADSSGQLHAHGIDLMDLSVAPGDSNKLYVMRDTLWFNNQVGSPKALWPPASILSSIPTPIKNIYMGWTPTDNDTIDCWKFNGTDSVAVDSCYYAFKTPPDSVDSIIIVQGANAIRKAMTSRFVTWNSTIDAPLYPVKFAEGQKVYCIYRRRAGESFPGLDLNVTVPYVHESVPNIGYADSFVAANSQYVDLGSSADFSAQTDSITVEAWEKHNDNVGSYTVYATYGRLYLTVIAGEPRFTFWDGSAYVYCGVGKGAISSGYWHYIAATYDKQKVRLYVDGVKIDSTAETNSIAYVNNATYIGDDPFAINDGYFNGVIDELHMYKRPLPEDSITAHWNSGAGLYGSDSYGLVVGYHFDEGTGTIAHDFSSNHHDGTQSGSVGLPTWVKGKVSPP